MAKHDGVPSLPKRRLAERLRDARHAQGLTGQQVADRMGWSAPTQSRIERGHLGHLREHDLRALCQVLDITDPEEIAALLSLLAEASAKATSWWQQFDQVINERLDVYVGLETDARSIDIFRPDLVPGLFQIADYARALNDLYFPGDSGEKQNQRIELKLRRQTSLTRKTDPMTVTLVLEESALRRVVGSERVMRAQLKHLAEMSQRPNLSIRVLPFTAGFPVGASTGPFSILEFESNPRIVYVEAFTSNMYLEADSDVTKYQAAFTSLHRATLDAVASRNLMRQVAKEFVT